MTPDRLIFETIRQLSSSLQCINSGHNLSVEHSGMVQHNPRHSFGMMFSCGCCDARIFQFHSEITHSTPEEQGECDCNVLALLQINFDCKVIGEYRLDGSDLSDLEMHAVVIPSADRLALAEARAVTAMALQNEDNRIRRVYAPDPSINKQVQTVSVETKKQLLSLTLDGCPICGCHKGNTTERLLASAGILDASLLNNKEHAKCGCDCPCCESSD